MSQDQWCRITVVGPDEAELASGVLEGPGKPDLGVVDDVARLALAARRLGGTVVLAQVAPELRELLELAGLVVEMEGEPEGRKQPLRIEQREEHRHVRDLAP
jgi:hypothetical protein